MTPSQMPQLTTGRKELKSTNGLSKFRISKMYSINLKKTSWFQQPLLRVLRKIWNAFLMTVLRLSQLYSSSKLLSNNYQRKLRRQIRLWMMSKKSKRKWATAASLRIFRSAKMTLRCLIKRLRSWKKISLIYKLQMKTVKI
jgi:hypothetical protein